MKTYEFKNILFDYFYNGITAEFPELTEKIYRERLRSSEPGFPFIVLKSGERVKINKRFEFFYKDGAGYIRAQFRLPVTFSIYDIQQNACEAEKFTDEVIDSIEFFFTGNSTVHLDLAEKGIVINELLSSGVIDKSEYCNTAQKFLKEITIVFEYEDIQAHTPGMGHALSVDIKPAG